MGYIESNLVPGERIVFKTRFHWWRWGQRALVAAAIIVVALLLLVAFALQPLLRQASPTVSTITLVSCVGLIIISGAFAALVIDYIAWSTSELGVTNRRILAKQGLLRRQITDISVSHFESCQIMETLGGRLLGYNTLILTGSGGTREEFRFVAHTRELCNHITEQVDLNRRS
jgi:uncharacterized membrane protein YdbT with pleckstrin-like domain